MGEQRRYLREADGLHVYIRERKVRVVKQRKESNVCRAEWPRLPDGMSFEVRQRVNGGVGRNDDADRITLVNGGYINNRKVLVAGNQHFITACHNKGIMTNYHRTNQIGHKAVMKGDIQTCGAIIPFALGNIKRRKLDIRYISKSN